MCGSGAVGSSHVVSVAEDEVLFFLKRDRRVLGGASRGNSLLLGALYLYMNSNRSSSSSSENASGFRTWWGSHDFTPPSFTSPSTTFRVRQVEQQVHTELPALSEALLDILGWLCLPLDRPVPGGGGPEGAGAPSPLMVVRSCMLKLRSLSDKAPCPLEAAITAAVAATFKPRFPKCTRAS